MDTSVLKVVFTIPQTLEAMDLIRKIGEEQNEAFGMTMQMAGTMAGLGYPTMITGASEAPYDILGDYFRGTLGSLKILLTKTFSLW